MRTLLFLATSAILFAGCSDAPPSGEFTLGPGNAQADGTATIEFQEFRDPLGVPSPLDPARCAQDEIPGTPPDQRCVYPYSTFNLNITLPTADPATPYVAFFLNGSGESQIGELALTGDVYTTQNTFTTDMSAPGSVVEVRMGDVVVATASGNEGANPFQVAPTVRGISGDATYRGRELTVTVAGLPENGTAMGRLYEEGSMEPVETFQVTNGENTYEASRNIASFSEFHIHLGNSKIALSETMIE